MTGQLNNEDIDKIFDYLSELIMQVPEKTNEIMEFSQRVKPLIQNQMTTADIYNEIAVENLELKELKQRVQDEETLHQISAHTHEGFKIGSCWWCKFYDRILKGNSNNQ